MIIAAWNLALPSASNFKSHKLSTTARNKYGIQCDVYWNAIETVGQ